MYLFHLFRSFLPLHNPIGFGARDFLEFGLVALLVLLAMGRAWIAPAARRLAEKTGWCMVSLGALTLALRLALLPVCPVPTARGADDYSYLLSADTLVHFRMANPPHPMRRFFETTFVLQEPTYSSIYPPGPGIAMAFGRLVFGLPWAGVVLSVALFCALCYWMLRAWTTPGWALVGGLLAICEFGPLSYWMNCYWGGAFSASAGCLVFGALPRLRRQWRTRDAALLGLGLGMQMLSRPYESVFLDLTVILFFVPLLRRRCAWPRLARAMPAVMLAVLPAGALVLLQNKTVTGDWLSLPYMASRYQYGVPTTLTFQANAVPHRQLTEDQQLYYEGQAAVHGEEPESFHRYVARLAGRVGFARFFLLAPLGLALPFFLPSLGEFRFVWVVLAVLVLALGSNFYAYFFAHYMAAAACLFILAGIVGLARLSALGIRGWPVGREAAQWIACLCAAHFLFWYGIHALGDEAILLAMQPYQTADSINYGDPDGRIAIDRQLARTPRRQLVFVRYWPQHEYHEWIHNLAEIDKARVVWALDLGPAEDQKLLDYYGDRTAWLLEPDARPPRLTPYKPRTEPPSAPSE